MSLWWQNDPSLWLSWSVSILKWVSILWHAACAPSDAKILEGGVYKGLSNMLKINKCNIRTRSICITWKYVIPFSKYWGLICAQKQLLNCIVPTVLNRKITRLDVCLGSTKMIWHVSVNSAPFWAAVRCSDESAHAVRGWRILISIYLLIHFLYIFIT